MDYCSSVFRVLWSCVFGNVQTNRRYGQQFQEINQFKVEDDSFELKEKQPFSQATRKQYLQIQSPKKQSSQQKQQYKANRATDLMDDLQKSFLSYLLQDNLYYKWLRPKMLQLQSLFNAEEKGEFITQGLRIGHNIDKDSGLNRFTQYYDLECSAQTYEAICNDFQLQKELDPNIDEYYKMMESPDGRTKLIYLSYKRFLVVAPRDFVYVRYAFRRGPEHWSVCTSVPHEDFAPKVRGDIIITVNRVVPTATGICVSVSSITDIKMKMNAEIAKKRTISETTKYYQAIKKHLKDYSQQI